MVRKTKNIETTVELHETVVLRGSAGWQFCPECAPTTVLMLSPEDAAALVGIPARVTYRWFEDGSIHSIENRDGSVLVCLRSLLRARDWAKSSPRSQLEE